VARNLADDSAGFRVAGNRVFGARSIAFGHVSLSGKCPGPSEYREKRAKAGKSGHFAHVVGAGSNRRF
jgi:hypothetical protein